MAYCDACDRYHTKTACPGCHSPAAPAPDAGPRCSWCDGTGTVRYTRNSPGGGTDVPCPACAPRPDAAVDQHIRVRFRDTGRAEPRVEVDQHREGECDCCDEWRGALQAERARAEAAEEKAADWHRLADERSAAIVAAEARAARMEAALREARKWNGETKRAIIDAALSPAPPEGSRTWVVARTAAGTPLSVYSQPEGPCVHGVPVARCAWCAVQGPEGDGDRLAVLDEIVPQVVSLEHGEKWSALGKEADGE